MLHEYIEENEKRTKVITTVHDSVVLDIPEDEIIEMIQVTKIIMENLPIDFIDVDLGNGLQKYPITSDAEIGMTYGDLVSFDLEEFKTFSSAEGYIKYHRDIHEVTANKDSKEITDEQADEIIATIEASKPAYQEYRRN